MAKNECLSSTNESRVPIDQKFKTPLLNIVQVSSFLEGELINLDYMKTEYVDSFIVSLPNISSRCDDTSVEGYIIFTRELEPEHLDYIVVEHNKKIQICRFFTSKNKSFVIRLCGDISPYCLEDRIIGVGVEYIKEINHEALYYA